MPRNFRITCPHCQHPDIRISPENIGRRVRCKFCSQVFQAELPFADQAAAVRIYGELQHRIDHLERQARTLQEQLEAARQRAHFEIALRQEVELVQEARVKGLEDVIRGSQIQVEALRAEFLSLLEAKPRGAATDPEPQEPRGEGEPPRSESDAETQEPLRILEALRQVLETTLATLRETDVRAVPDQRTTPLDSPSEPSEPAY